METEVVEPKEYCLARLKKTLQSFIKSAARKLAKKVVANPRRTVIIYLIVLLFAALGFLRMKSAKNNDVADLFTPGDSESHNEKDVLNKYFAPADDSFQIIAVPVSEGYTFNTKAWDELLTMEKKLVDLRVEGVSAEDFCSTLMDGSCLHFSPFMYFDWNVETIASANKTSTICNHEKNYIPFYYIFGDTANVTVENCLDSKDGIVKASAFSIYFAMSFDKYNETIPHKWIKEAEKIVSDFQDDSKYWETYYMSSYGLSNEVERGTLQTMTKIVISIVLVIILLIIALHENSWGISISLALVALVSVLLACVMGLGISLLVGLPWTTITPVIIFLALGLGVDNCVLLTILFYRGDKYYSFEKRMMDAASEAALFNTLSTLTTVLAFIMGVNSSFKGIRTFCLSSAIVMTCIFFTTFTFYMASLTMIMSKHEAKENASQSHGKRRRRRKHRKEKEDWITHFYRTVVSKIFLSIPARIVVLVLFTCLLIYASYLISTIQQGIVPEDAVPEDSFVTAYLQTARVHFKEKVAEMNVVFYDTAVERSTRRAIIADVIKDMKTVDFVMPSYENPWEIFDNFLKENNIDPDRASGMYFYYYLLMCIRYNPRIAEHISIDLDNYEIPASKVKFALHPDAVQNIEQGERTLIGTRDVLGKYRDEYGVYVNMKSYSTMYPYYEMVGIIFRETITNLISSAIAVTIVLLLLLPPGPSILAVICVLLADVCILGWIPFTGLNLNAISSTCLVMSVGIAVDFMAHITHAFVETDGTSMTGGERAAATVTRMGRSLTTSALTTFLSVLMLSVVNVPSNRMFFTMMAGVVLFGLLFGIILLPTILSFVNPRHVKPVEIGTPMTPLPPGEEAAMLEKTRNHGLRRHHRHHKRSMKDEEKKDEEKEEDKEEREKKLEAIDDSDGSFQDCLSDHDSLVSPKPELSQYHSDDDDDLPVEKPTENSGEKPLREIEMVPITKKEEGETKKEEEGEVKKEEEEKKGEVKKEEGEKKGGISPKPNNTTTAIKRFKRPREKTDENPVEQNPEPEHPNPEQPADKGGLLDYLWSLWGSK